MQANGAATYGHGGEITSKALDGQGRYYFIMFKCGPIMKNVSVCRGVVVAVVRVC